MNLQPSTASQMIGQERGTAELSIVIINWRSVDFTRRCLETVYANAKDMAFEIIVVDNASWDGCDEMLKAEFPEVVFVQSQTNLGFAGANNLGFSRCRGQYVLFLNPDTEIQGQALQILLASLRGLPDAGMVGAKLLNSDLSIQTSCVSAFPSITNQALNCEQLRKMFPKWRLWGMRALFENRHEPTPVESISGACMLMTADVFRQVGGFSTEYFMYSEDIMLSYRVGQTGREIYYVPDATIIHHGGQSSSRRESNFSDIMKRKSMAQFMRVRHGAVYALLFRVSTGVMAAFRLLILSLLSPSAIQAKGRHFLYRAFRRWSAVLGWSVGSVE
jgi:GT2 family glycosyltransferase